MSKQPKLTLDTVEQSLSEEERPIWDAFCAELAQPGADEKDIRQRFISWAGPVAARAGCHPGRVFGLVAAHHKPKKPREEAAPGVALEALPTPLVRAVQAWRSEDTATRPFRAVHRLIDALEVLCKLYTVAGVSTFVDALGRHLDTDEPERRKSVDGIRTMLASGLRTPSLGIWWGFARDTARALDALDEAHVLPGASKTLTSEKSRFKKAFNDGRDNLISFRNGYAHGATPSDAHCTRDLQKYGARVDALLAAAHPLAAAELLVATEDGVLLARGTSPLPCPDPPSDLVPGHCYLRGQEGLLVDLHPLLVHDEESGEDGAFFFYNDLRENHASLLNYPAALHRRDKPLREVLLGRFPLDEWKRIGGADLDPFRERIEALTEVFKGRTAELQALATFLTETDRGFHVVWGPPGVGKSTLLARMTQLLRWAPELRDQATPGLEWPGLRITVVEYFIRRGATDTATRLLDSVNQRLDARFGLRLPPATTDEERRQGFVARLQTVSRRLEEDQRLVLVLDGLDEARRDDPILGVLPREVPPGVLVLYGSRPQQLLRYGFYDELDRERKSFVDLTGLSLPDTRALLYEHVDKYALEHAYAEAVLAQSEGNPLYLKLLCQGLEQGTYALNAAAELPKNMTELYAAALVRIQKDHERAVDLLTLLAAARDFVSPAMAAELMGMSSGALDAGPLSACMELLYENPLTEGLEDYQLFHESLREHLRDKHAGDVFAWEEKLAAWATDWRTENGDPRHRAESRAYAMAWAVPHQADCLARAAHDGRTGEAASRGDTILSLVEDEPWRALCFRACGNGAPLQRAIRHAQDVVRGRDAAGSERERLLRFARWRYDEPYRLYLAQRDELRTAKATPKAQKAFLEEVVQLAQMGARPRDRVMLALTALWAPARRPDELPQALKQSVGRWLEEAREPALDKLWAMSGGVS